MYRFKRYICDGNLGVLFFITTTSAATSQKREQQQQQKVSAAICPDGVFTNVRFRRSFVPLIVHESSVSLMFVAYFKSSVLLNLQK